MAPYNKTIWVDGSAPAITADKLNNLEKQYDEALAWAKSFGLGGDAQAIDGTDLNALNKTGFYKGGSLTNAPTGITGAYVIHIQYDVNSCYQILFRTNSSEYYTRRKLVNVWSAWTASNNIIDPIPIAEPGTSYPAGVSIFDAGGVAGFPAVYGTVVTQKFNENRMTQWFYRNGNTSEYGAWYRHYHTNPGWSQWFRVKTVEESVLVFAKRASSNQSIPTNAYTRVIFNWVELPLSNNRGTTFNTSTGEFTAPVNGQYRVDIGVLLTGIPTGGYAVFHLYLNGANIAELARVTAPNTAAIQGSGGLSLYLNAGDRIDIRVHPGATSANVINGSYFTIAQL